MKIDGRKIRDEIVQEIGTRLHGTSVYFLQFGANEVSERFVQRKLSIAQKLGVHATYSVSAAMTTESAMHALTEAIQQGPDGVVIQLPIPAPIDSSALFSAIPSTVDIDFLNPETYAKFALQETQRVPPVAAAILEFFKQTKTEIYQKNIVIIGKGKLVGKPLATVFDCQKISYQIFDIESNPELLLEALHTADIIISGTGAPHSIKPDMVQDGVILIDAGTSEQNGVIVGDIDPACYEKALWYTPVPGGVGPVTVACLFKNIAQ